MGWIENMRRFIIEMEIRVTINSKPNTLLTTLLVLWVVCQQSDQKGHAIYIFRPRCILFKLDTQRGWLRHIGLTFSEGMDASPRRAPQAAAGRSLWIWFKVIVCL